MSQNKTLLWITRSAIFLALLLVAQFATRSLGQYVTGSLVNLLLVLSTLLCGLACGATVALLSPLLAFLLGVGPALPQIVAVVMLGNLTLVALWHLMTYRLTVTGRKLQVSYATTLIVASCFKCAVLFLGVTKVALPMFLSHIPDAQAAALSTMFSFPQLITALIGGALAALLSVPLKKALNPQRSR